MKCQMCIKSITISCKDCEVGWCSIECQNADLIIHEAYHTKNYDKIKEEISKMNSDWIKDILNKDDSSFKIELFRKIAMCTFRVKKNMALQFLLYPGAYTYLLEHMVRALKQFPNGSIDALYLWRVNQYILFYRECTEIICDMMVKDKKLQNAYAYFMKQEIDDNIQSHPFQSISIMELYNPENGKKIKSLLFSKAFTSLSQKQMYLTMYKYIQSMVLDLIQNGFEHS